MKSDRKTSGLTNWNDCLLSIGEIGGQFGGQLAGHLGEQLRGQLGGQLEEYERKWGENGEKEKYENN